jgi:hypothetical protein
MDLECTVCFYNPTGSAELLHRYRIVAEPGLKAGSAVAEAMPETEGKVQREARPTTVIAQVDEGGLAAAIDKAVAILAERHPGLKLISSQPGPRQRSGS